MAKDNKKEIKKKITDDVKKQIEKMNTKMSEMGANISQNAKKLEKQAQIKIKEHPIEAVAISFGVGLVAGAVISALMTRKCCHN